MRFFITKPVKKGRTPKRTVIKNMNEGHSEVSHFRTTDICLASALCSGGYQIEAIEKGDSSKSIFYIKRDRYLDETLRLYFTHQLKVEPLNFFNFLKEIKTRIYHA